MKYNVELRTIDGIIIQLENLIEIRDNSTSYMEVDFEKFILLKNYSYTFVCENDIFTIEAANLLYVQVMFVRA